MLKKCPYCNETHYESSDRIDCMEIVIAREGVAYKALARSYESLRKAYDSEHVVLKSLVENLQKLGTSTIPLADAEKALAVDTGQILRGEGPDKKSS